MNKLNRLTRPSNRESSDSRNIKLPSNGITNKLLEKYQRSVIIRDINRSRERTGKNGLS